MAGNMRYESNSASPEESTFMGSYPNVQKGNYLSSSLDRSSSFRESNESRSFSSGASMSRASASSEVGSLAQYLLLDPITMGDQKYTRSGELRRLLGISLGNGGEHNSFGAAHSKLPPPVATEDLKHFKASLSESTLNARFRTKRLNESLIKVNKLEALNLKKQHRNDMLISERSSASNSMKMGIQIHRNASDIGAQRSEERNKNIVLNKRVRSSVSESRADSRSNVLPKQQLGKDREMLRDGGEGSDLTEEKKVRRMPTGGEGWDRKMKRKRSVGSVFARSTDSDGEIKRVIHHKLNNEPSLQSYEGHGFCSGSLNGTCGINKLDGSSSPTNSNPCTVLKNECDKVSLTRDFSDGLNKERLVSKANNKLNFLEGNHSVGPTPVAKGKASRTRTGSVSAANLSPNFSRSSGALDGWERPSSINKVNSFVCASNRKHSLPAGPSSPPMAQWVGQRPQKISRTRRANVVSPLSNHDEVQMSPEGAQRCTSDFASRLTSAGCNGSLLAKDMANKNLLAKVKIEKVSSPVRLSESEESGGGENHESRHKGTGSGVFEERSQNQNIGPSVVLTKKNNVLNREDTGDGLRRQGRTGRGALYSRASISPVREKLESPVSAKPIKSAKPVSEKNGSKSGRPPLKKISDRKSFTRGQTAAGGSSDFSGESDDDREELLAAANYACNASYLCCSSTFWKKVEPIFTSPSLEDLSYLNQQLKSIEELHESMFDMSNLDNNTLGDIVCKDNFKSHIVSGESKKCLHELDWPKRLLKNKNMTNQDVENGSSCGIEEGINQVTPLYQRILSALIVEDEPEEFEENNICRRISFQSSRDRSPGDACFPIDFESRIMDGMDFDYDSMLGFRAHKQSAVDNLSCNGNGAGLHNLFDNDDFFQGGQGFMNLKVTKFPEHLGDDDRNLSLQMNLDFQYQQSCLEDRLLMELQSIGLYPEAEPDLADGEDEAINQDIIELHKGFLLKVAKMKASLKKIMETVEEGKKVEAGALEQAAMDKLVELAYKKLLATKGSCASKFGVPKVPRPLALAFMKRTLARCRKFEETGKSCFGEPPLWDVILATPACVNHIGLAFKSNMNGGILNSQHEFGVSVTAGTEYHVHNEKSRIHTLTHSHDYNFVKSGPLLSRGKKEVRSRGAPSLGNGLLSGTKGKRSERERGKDAFARTKGDCKTKAKPKQKTAHLSTSGDGIGNKFKDMTSINRQEPGPNYDPQSSSKDVGELQDLSLELGIENDIGGNQDLCNLFNFDEDGLPENDLMGLDLPMDGLEIPMDDLSELNMLL